MGNHLLKACPFRTGGSLKRTASDLSDIAVQAFGTKKHKNASTAAGEDLENADNTIEETSVPPLDSEVAEAGTDEAKVTTPPKTWKEAPYTFFPPDHRHLKSCLCVLHWQGLTGTIDELNCRHLGISCT